MIRSKHDFWIARCVKLAEKGRGNVSPNPMVGACLVKGGRLISEGYHARFGGPHAEVACLRKAGWRAKGAALYVNLEPCSTYGKTPPCTEAILKSDVKEVIIGALDPNPRHFKKGIAILKRAGIQVQSGVLADQVMKQNEPFFTFHRKKRPFVVLKMAESLNGKITTGGRPRQWISGLRARRWSHGLRRQVDAVLVGTRTVETDNPRLTPYLSNSKSARVPLRVILDRTLKLARNFKVFSKEARTVVFTSSRNPRKKIEAYAKSRGVAVVPVGEKNERLAVKEILRCLYRLGISSLMVEGGAEVSASFLEAGAVDKICMFVAPFLLDGGGKMTRLTNLEISQIGKDMLIQGHVYGNR